MDRIFIDGLRIRTIIGINPQEREERQDVIVHIVLHADLSAAGRSDRIEDTVNYRTINKRVIEVVEGSRFHLVEALAEAVARVCLDDEGVRRVEVRVEKPGALRFTRTVGVEISRSRE